MSTKQTYEQIKDVYIINILNYEMTNFNKYCLDTVTVENEYRNYELVKGLKYYFIELPKFRKQVKIPKTKLEHWLAFIDYENKEMVKMAIEKNELVKKAHQDYEYLTGEAATRRLQELRERAILDENSAYETGRKRGRASGKIEGKIETARAMLQNNIKLDIIAKCTGLNIKELDRILGSSLKSIR